MDRNGRGVLLGVVGVLFVVGAAVLGLNWGAETVKTASLPLDAPILFQPK